MSDYLSGLFSLADRVAIVTGGSSGIGQAMAAALARAGAQVVLVARDSGRLEESAASLRAQGCSAAWVSTDLSDRAAVELAAAAAATAFGEPDILINCAGINLRPPLAELTPDQWDLSMAVNLTAPFLLGQRFGPSMAARGWGRIVNVTSQQAGRAFANSGGYGASKGGLAALTRSQSEAWARSGVCCNSVCPGFVPTRGSTRPWPIIRRSRRRWRPGPWWGGTASLRTSPGSPYSWPRAPATTSPATPCTWTAASPPPNRPRRCPSQHRAGADEAEGVRGQAAAAGQRLTRRLLVQPRRNEAYMMKASSAPVPSITRSVGGAGTRTGGRPLA